MIKGPNLNSFCKKICCVYSKVRNRSDELCELMCDVPGKKFYDFLMRNGASQLVKFNARHIAPPIPGETTKQYNTRLDDELLLCEKIIYIM